MTRIQSGWLVTSTSVAAPTARTRQCTSAQEQQAAPRGVVTRPDALREAPGKSGRLRSCPSLGGSGWLHLGLATIDRRCCFRHRVREIGRADVMSPRAVDGYGPSSARRTAAPRPRRAPRAPPGPDAGAAGSRPSAHRAADLQADRRRPGSASAARTRAPRSGSRALGVAQQRRGLRALTQRGAHGLRQGSRLVGRGPMR